MLHIFRTVALSKAFVIVAHAGIAQESTSAEMRMMGQFEGCVISEISFEEARLTGIQLSDSRINDVAFDGAALSISVFDGARLTNVSFEGANLRGASFVNAVLVNVSFKDADLQAAVFEGARLEGTDLSLGLLCKTQMPDDVMDNSGCN